VHPAAWRGVGKADYFALLDRVVTWATELELYLIIDWHSIGNLVTELYQHPMYETTQQETFEFWRSISYRYQDVPTIAFYEIFNEPTVYGGNLGRASWQQWKALNEEIISIIYSHDRKVVPLVAGFNWAFDLREVKKAPIDRPGIGYVSHPYPEKVKRPYEKQWDDIFGFVAKKYPLITTEIGYMPADAPGAHIPVKDDGTYGKLITDYLAARGASWVAWCFHPHWAPPLIKDWSYEPNLAGAHFRSVMLERKSREQAAEPKAESKVAPTAAP
jgi:aryl-phospho-beta-D-glucosidase BglC (GH1 family)